jgi:hypothetical protein
LETFKSKAQRITWKDSFVTNIFKSAILPCTYLHYNVLEHDVPAGSAAEWQVPLDYASMTLRKCRLG